MLLCTLVCLGLRPAHAQAATLTVVNEGPLPGTRSTGGYHGADGEGILYCGDRDKAGPATGTAYTGGTHTGSLALDYALYHGYDGDNNKNVYGYTGNNARLMTSYVVWCIREGNTSAPEQYSLSANYLAAIKRFYNDARAYEARGGGGPEQGCSIIWNSPAGDVQNLIGRVIKGTIALSKVSLLPAVSDDNAAYSLAGATYGIYSNPACTAQIATLTTGEDGKARSQELMPATYYVREIEAPAGYALDTTCYSVSVAAGQEAQVNVSTVGDMPLTLQLSPLLVKRDATSGSEAQGDATLEGAEFTLEFYAGATSVEGLPDHPTRIWVLASDASGTVSLDAEHWRAGDELYTGVDGRVVLPLGVLTLRETKAPAGYTISDTGRRAIKIAANAAHTAAEAQMLDDWPQAAEGGQRVVFDEVMRGGVRITKYDAELMSGHAQGAASLAGAEFCVRNISAHPVVVGGVVFQPGDDVVTLVTDETGVAVSASDALPFGTYEIRETKAPRGYNISGEVRSVEVREQGVICEVAPVFSDAVVRGDLCFNKVDGRSMKPLAGVPFRLTSTSTGESHVIVTDANGYATTASSWYGRTTSNQADDSASPAAGGVWFYGRDDEHKAPVREDRGALPYDTYELEELRCEANAGRNLIKREVTISREATCVDLGTINDYPASMRSSAASAKSSAKEALAEANMRVVDTIAYDGLTEGERYTISGTLMDASTGEAVLDAAGEPVRGTTDLVADHPTGEAQVVFDFDGSTLAGHDVVCFERLLSETGEVEAAHEDLSAHVQTVHMPTITTTATGVETGTHEACPTKHTKLVDTIAYSNLTEGREYTLTAELYDRATGEPLVASSGESVSTTSSFTAQGSSGTTEITFDFDGRAYAGHTVVVFERIFYNGHEVANHTDIADEAQSVRLPRLTTSAHINETTLREGDANQLCTVVDELGYENLTPGQTYEVVTSLMDPESKEEIGVAGEVLSAHTAFVCEKAEGSFEVTLDVPAGLAPGKTLVVCERIYCQGTLVAEHADADAAEQTIRLVVLATHASDPEDGDQCCLAARETCIRDTVSYQGLEAGANYELQGVLMDRASGQPVLDAAGEEVHTQTTFTPADTTGEISLDFEADLSLAANTDVVVFETLMRDGTQVASHANLDDGGQTVQLVDQEAPQDPLAQTGRPAVAALLAGAGLAMVGAVRTRGRRRP